MRRGFQFQTDYSSEFAVAGIYTLTSGVTTEYVVEFDVGRWFRKANLWLDPSDRGNYTTIIDNIRRNIKVTRDVEA
jgi:hypothetical protein